MFIDVAKINLKAGNGGDGAVAFHREKYVDSGGPDGGDGGRGGDIILVADDNLSTLMDFRYKRKYAAQSGEGGKGANQSGRAAQNLVIKVPRGTLVKDAESGLIIADISGDEPFVICKGGKGGAGNQHFATPTRQIPRFAKPGGRGEERTVLLELKLIADVGLVGFPNVGKSTLISVLSDAKPKIANYHFTTISPVLGVVKVDEEVSFVCADIPGLIEGASSGVGLGHAFLRHVERCRLIVHVVDVSGSEGRDPKEDFELINKELANFNKALAAQPQIVLGNKADIATEEQIEQFRQFITAQGLEFRAISAATHMNIDGLKGLIYNKLKDLPPVVVYEPEFIAPQQTPGKREFTIVRADDAAFVVNAPFLNMNYIDTDDYETLHYFQRQLVDSGIIDKLLEMGVKEGDIVRVGDFEFEYIF